MTDNAVVIRSASPVHARGLACGRGVRLATLCAIFGAAGCVSDVPHPAERPTLNEGSEPAETDEVYVPADVGASCSDGNAVASWRVSDNPHSRISAVVDVQTLCDAKVAVRVVGPGVDGRQTRWTSVGASHHIEVVGMRASSTYALQVLVEGPDGDAWQQLSPTTYTTGQVPVDAPRVEVPWVVPALTSTDITLVGTWEGSFQAEEVAFIGLDPAGEVVWYWGEPGVTKAGSVRQAEDGNLWVIVADAIREITPGGELLSFIDLTPFDFHHDAEPLPNGNWLLIGYDKREIDTDGDGELERVIGDRVVEITSDGQEVNSWSMFDLLPNDRYPTAMSRSPSHDLQGLDWTHGNGITYVPSDDSFLVSLRSQHWVVKVDRATGALVWTMGPGGDFTLRDGDAWFYGQHAPVMHPDGSLMVYDNGNERDDGITTSRVVRVGFDEDTMHAEVVWAFDTGVYTGELSSARVASNGNIEVCAGSWSDNPEDDISKRHASLIQVTGDRVQRTTRRIELSGISFRANPIEGFWADEE